jgi:metal-responsive CopG/Arc/MetJ family transcriptional regulator
MSAISLRLPEELETRLDGEAALEGVSRSELARKAIADYLERRERERFMEELVAEARAAYADEAIRKEAVEMAEDFLPLDNEALDLAVSEENQNEKWWK